jgi:hypothetical protein
MELPSFRKRNIGRRHAVEFEHQLLGVPVLGEVGVQEILPGMNAGVGASATHNFNSFVAMEFAQCILDFFLNGVRFWLYLPSVIVASVVSELNKKTRHFISVLRFV